MTHDEIRAWLDSLDIKNYTIHENGVVDVDGTVPMGRFRGGTFPVQFGVVKEHFGCGTSLTSLRGSPQSVGGGFSCNDAKITSLMGAPKWVGGLFNCYATEITSLHNVHKQIYHIGGWFYCDDHVTHLLGLLLIDGITGFDIDSDGPIDKIFNKYVGTGDIISAQDELIDAGFIEQARL
jgi:hypothetical protein